jgi:hypothetical protein
MHLDPDFSEFIACCLARDVQLLIVGGYAVAAHGHPRYTKDLDVWVLADQDNADRLPSALADFGFGDVGLVRADFTEPGRVVQRWGTRPSASICSPTCRASSSGRATPAGC